MTSHDHRHVISVADPAAMAIAAAERVIARISENPGRVAICLTGGSSPKALYQLLATDSYRGRIPWQRVHWFIGDERFVQAGDPLNNMGMARQIFLDRWAPASNSPATISTCAGPAICSAKSSRATSRKSATNSSSRWCRTRSNG